MTKKDAGMYKFHGESEFKSRSVELFALVLVARSSRYNYPLTLKICLTEKVHGYVAISTSKYIAYRLVPLLSSKLYCIIIIKLNY